MRRTHSLIPAALISFTMAAATLMGPPASACLIIDPHPHPPIPPHRHPPIVRPMETRSHEVDVRIRDQVARVHVRAVFFNPNSFDLEGTFPVSTRANVSSFSMEVDGRVAEAELLDADRARRIYEDIVRRKRDPGLLEWVGDRMIRARVFPIPPRGEVEIELVYEELLRAEGGLLHFHYPLRSARPLAGSIDDVRINVDVSSQKPLKNVYSPTHEVDVRRDGERTADVLFEARRHDPDKDFDLYALADGNDLGVSLLCHRGAGDGGSFLMLLSPREDWPAADALPKRVVFVLDRSGSMSGRKIEQARQALRFALSGLEPGDDFGVVAFSTDVEPFRDELMPATRTHVREALEFVGGLGAGGGTAIHDSLHTALDLLGPEDERTLSAVVFITDGQPTVGETSIDRIVSEVKRANESRARLFVFGVGDDVNTDLLDLLARENRGTREYVRPYEDLEIKISNLTSKIATPLLADVELSVRGVTVSEVYPRVLPDLFRGTQLAVVGRYDGSGRARVVLEGGTGDGRRRFEYPVSFEHDPGNGFVHRQWAVRKVAFLLEEIRLRGSNPELIAEVERLGKRHGILTPYTSFLIVDEAELAKAPPEVRRRLEGAVGGLKKSFERQKAGRAAVDAASAVAYGADAAPAPTESVDQEMQQLVGRELAEQLGGKSDAWAGRMIRQDAVVHAGDKTFLSRADGFLYDSTYRDGMPTETVGVGSERYFELLGIVPGIGRYLALSRDIVIVAGERAYRIEGH